MSLVPGKKGVYHISSVPRAPEYRNGIEVFKGHGSDGTHSTDNVIYIMSDPLERVVAFKAFFDSFKINLTKEIEKKEDADKDSTLVKQYGGLIEYNLGINIPAHSVNEAVNNIAKIEELQKLIAPLDPSNINGVPLFNVADSVTTMPLFLVLMKNLISNGNKDVSLKNAQMTASIIRKAGLPCSIMEVNYEPDIEAGFFEFGNYFYPKNIKLNLKMSYEPLASNKVGDPETVLPFEGTGEFSEGDYGTFPFGIGVDNGEYEEQNSIELYSDYTSKTVNRLDFSGERESTYIFISDGPIMNSESIKSRWLVFKPFIENFSRSHSTSITTLNNKALDIRGKIKPGSTVSFGSLIFNLKFNLPAKNVEESKKNCGKLSHLIRMFYIKQNEESTDTNTQRVMSFYIPGMLEKPGASRSFPSHSNPERMFDNALPFYVENLNFDVDLESGFFEENGNLYPKAMSIDISFFYADGNLIKNYRYDEALTGGNYQHMVGAFPGQEHLFPYNRKTITLGRSPE